MFAVNQYSPKTQVVVHTWRGESYDLTEDLMNWQTQKSLSQPQGTFIISLVARRDKNGDWADKVQAMDYVEILASANGKPIPIMRGFVDYSGRSTVFGPSGGPSEPRITITGRDYSKLLLDWQVLYLWSQNNQAQAALGSTPFGASLNWLYNFGIKTIAASVFELFSLIFNNLVNPITHDIRQKWISQVPDFYLINELPDFEMSMTPIYPYTGSYWNLFSYFSSPPFGEIFVWDDTDYPVFTARMTPYRAWDGTVPSPGKDIKPSLTISTTDVQSYTLGRSDTDVYNYYLTYGDMSGHSSQQTMAAFTTTPKNGVNISGQDLYGTRPLVVDTPWVNAFDFSNTSKANSDPYSVADELNQWMVKVMQDNQRFRSGTMQLQGRETYRIGQYVTIDGWNEEYYIAGVSHSYEQFVRWDTTLQLTRGRIL